ncbi:hypothetical protein NIES806_05040 [Dolichospermum compactum NIES-806]|jgi:hypothetical protein|uniref:Uncharacterized protein n=1 Tax=Dolichospermum compactum NIES-806 TaxID=1973481 RepID=A0A1Z4UYI8_9CYAN|nr:hypothetical protein NIES806_05040 [Dolichospermum compactum NIES-806]
MGYLLDTNIIQNALDKISHNIQYTDFIYLIS